MKTIDLWNQVTKLIFNDQIEDQKAFYVAANRAYMRVNRYDPIRRSAVIVHRPIEPKTRIVCILHPFGETIPVNVCGGLAFSFRATGTGNVKVTAYGEDRKPVTQTIYWNRKDTRYGYECVSGFLIPPGSVYDAPQMATSAVFEFGGSYRYQVDELQIFDEVVSNSVADIHEYGDWVPYDMTEAVPDFFAFSDIPVKYGRDEQYVSADRYLIRGSVIQLPSSESGEYLVEYEKKLDEIKEGVDFELDEEFAQVMAYAVAAELWLDVEAEKASYYEDMFVRTISTIMATRKSRENPIVITNGWEN